MRAYTHAYVCNGLYIMYMYARTCMHACVYLNNFIDFIDHKGSIPRTKELCPMEFSYDVRGGEHLLRRLSPISY